MSLAENPTQVLQHNKDALIIQMRMDQQTIAQQTITSNPGGLCILNNLLSSLEAAQMEQVMGIYKALPPEELFVQLSIVAATPEYRTYYAIDRNDTDDDVATDNMKTAQDALEEEWGELFFLTDAYLSALEDQRLETQHQPNIYSWMPNR